MDILSESEIVDSNNNIVIEKTYFSIVTVRKRFVCELCNKQYRSYKYLQAHTRSALHCLNIVKYISVRKVI